MGARSSIPISGAPASIMPSGFIDPASWTTGCSIRRTVPRPRVRASCRGLIYARNGTLDLPPLAQEGLKVASNAYVVGISSILLVVGHSVQQLDDLDPLRVAVSFIYNRLTCTFIANWHRRPDHPLHFAGSYRRARARGPRITKVKPDEDRWHRSCVPLPG